MRWLVLGLVVLLTLVALRLGCEAPLDDHTESIDQLGVPGDDDKDPEPLHD